MSENKDRIDHLVSIVNTRLGGEESGKRFVDCKTCGAKAYTPRQLAALDNMHQMAREGSADLQSYSHEPKYFQGVE